MNLQLYRSLFPYRKPLPVRFKARKHHITLIGSNPSTHHIIHRNHIYKTPFYNRGQIHIYVYGNNTNPAFIKMPDFKLYIYLCNFRQVRYRPLQQQILYRRPDDSRFGCGPDLQCTTVYILSHLPPPNGNSSAIGNRSSRVISVCIRRYRTEADLAF